MDIFDSRTLRYIDCFGQRFMKPGSYPYAVSSAAQRGVRTDTYPFVIHVGEDHPPEEMTQHTVRIRQGEDGLIADRAELRIDQGDMVLFSAFDARTPPYVIAGEKDFFTNVTLRAEAGYSHAFGVEGNYEWADANGSKLGGSISVTSPPTETDKEREEWIAQLRKGALVMVTGEEAKPARLKILTGQTVFWAITKTPGVTITDSRLLKQAGDSGPSREQRAKPPT